MFTLIGFNQAASAYGSWVNIEGADDQTVHVVGDVIYVPDRFTKILWCCAVGLDVVRAKLESPSIRRIGVMMIEPKSNYTYPAMQYYPVARYTPRSPITLAGGEGLEAFVYVGSDVTNLVSIGVCLGDALVTPVEGEIWTIRATYASMTTEQGKWINTEVTFDETLPVGRYQVVGCSCYNETGSLFRLVPVGGENRPGGIAGGGAGSIEPDWQRLGKMGVWCEFHSSTPPSLDILSYSAQASTGSIELDIIKIA